MAVDVVFMVHNRLEFTYASLTWLLHTLSYEEVNRLWLVDDSSDDGVSEYLQNMTTFVGNQLVETRYLRTCCKSMSISFGCFLEKATTDIVCKVDNDLCILEQGWLSRMLRVIDCREELCCLGITNPVMERVLEGTDEQWTQGYIPAPHIGGIGLFRRDMFDVQRLRNSAFTKSDRKYLGIQAAQERDGRIKGWFTPFLKTELLDRPSEWKKNGLLRRLHDKYEKLGYGRANEAKQ